MANYVLVLAGGVGSRTEQSIPKQFISVNDNPIIIYTLEVFEKCQDIDGIIVTCLRGWQEPLKAYAKQYNITKFKDVIAGGVTRLDSLRIGCNKICEFAKDDDLIITHDGVRALVTEDLIEDSIRVARDHNLVVALQPAVDTMYITKDFCNIDDTTNRDVLACGHTPVTVKVGFYKEMFKKLDESGKDGGNCIATAALAINEKIYGSKSSSRNIKITTKEDIDIFKGLKLLDSINHQK